MSKGYMYILQCADGSYYTGSTRDLEQRFNQHQNGAGANYTRKRLPVKLVFQEEFSRIDEAFRREKQVQAMINGEFDKLPLFSECKNESHFRNRPFDSAQGTRLRPLKAVETNELNISDAPQTSTFIDNSAP